MRILLTSTSFQDSPGRHQELLNETGFKIDTLRGPVQEDKLLTIIANYDGLICGDDEITEKVIVAGKKGKLKIISKYGIGLDKVDLSAAEKYKLPVTNCQGVNHITVAEHVLALLLTYVKNIHLENNITRKGEWERLIGNEIYGKKIGILGLGRIGKEVAIRAKSFGMLVYVHDENIQEDFINANNLIVLKSPKDLAIEVDILSINLPLTNETKSLINSDILKSVNKNLIIINTSRALVIDQKALIDSLENKTIKAYLTDVMDEEPMVKNHQLLQYENVIITPHIGSRTYESIERQGIMAVENLIRHLKK